MIKQISYQKFRDFLDSDLDEATYFNLNKDNLITLKDYLLDLEERFFYYESEILGDKIKIMERYPKIKNLRYSMSGKELRFDVGNSSFNLVKLLSPEGHYQVVLEDCFESMLIEEIKCFKYRNLGKQFVPQLDHIKENSLKYFDKTNVLDSISSVFTLKDHYFQSFIYCNNYPLFSYDRRDGRVDEYTYEVFPEYYDEKEKLSLQDKQKLLTKIQIKKNYKL